MPIPVAVPTLPMLLAALVVALVVLAAAVAALRRVARGSELARVPLAAAGDVRLDVAGPILLHGEGPHGTRRFAGLAVRLIDRASGAAVPSRPIWLRTTSSGWSRARIALRRFDVARPGVFRVEATGPAVGSPDDGSALVFMPPVGVRLPFAIVACVLAGSAAVAASVGIGWRAFGIAGSAGMLDGAGALDGVPAGALVSPPRAASPAPEAARRDAAPPPSTTARAGRQLRSDPSPTGATHTVHWTGAALTLTVPAEWRTRADGAELDLRDPAAPSAYLVGHVVTFPPPTTADVLARTVIESAAGRVASGLVAGFMAVRWGGVEGVLTIETRDDGAALMAVWSAYRPTPTGVRNVTLLLGADAATFAHLEPVAAAVFASTRFD